MVSAPQKRLPAVILANGSSMNGSFILPVSRDKPREPLNKFIVPLADRRIHNQGANSKACRGLLRMSNAECGFACQPRSTLKGIKAGLKRAFAVLCFLQRTTAIRCEARLATARFRLRRDTINLFRGSLDCLVH